MENTTPRNWSAKIVTRRIMILMAVIAIAASAYAVPAPAKAQVPSRTAYVSCQSASWKGNPSWSSPTIRTLYYGDHIGVRRDYNGGYYYENGFYLAQDYGWSGNDYWGYIWAQCTTWA